MSNEQRSPLLKRGGLRRAWRVALKAAIRDEAVADEVSVEWHPLLGREKDLANVAVMLTACWMVVV